MSKETKLSRPNSQRASKKLRQDSKHTELGRWRVQRDKILQTQFSKTLADSKHRELGRWRVQRHKFLQTQNTTKIQECACRARKPQKAQRRASIFGHHFCRFFIVPTSFWLWLFGHNKQFVHNLPLLFMGPLFSLTMASSSSA